jgi:hypothetical protein
MDRKQSQTPRRPRLRLRLFVQHKPSRTQVRRNREAPAYEWIHASPRKQSCCAILRIRSRTHCTISRYLARTLHSWTHRFAHWRSTHRSTRSHPFTSERVTREAVRKATGDSRATASPYRYRTGVRVLKNEGGKPPDPQRRDGASLHDAPISRLKASSRRSRPQCLLSRPGMYIHYRI